MGLVNHTLYPWIAMAAPAGATLFWLSALAVWPAYAVPPLMAGLWWFCRNEDRHAAVHSGLTALLALAAAGTLSALIDHPRPFMDGDAANLLNHEADSSFLSDHATLFVALAAAFLIDPPRTVPRLGVALAVVGLAVSWARVALGVYYPVDVAAAVVAVVATMLPSARPLQEAADMVYCLGEAVHRRLPTSWRLRRHAISAMDNDAHSPR